MITIRHPKAVVHPSDVVEVQRRETPFQVMAAMACWQALTLANISIPTPEHRNMGIVFSTVKGENYPEEWRKATRAGGRIRSTMFRTTVHNSAAGFCAISLNLQGPQITLVSGESDVVARLILEAGGSTAMLMCIAHLEGPATAWVLEAASDIS